MVSVARQTLDERSECLHCAIQGHIVGNAELLPPREHLLGDLLHGTNKDGWHLQDLLYRDTAPAASLRNMLGSLATILRKDRCGDDAQLKLREALSRCLLEPGDFLRETVRRVGCGIVHGGFPGVQRTSHNADNIGLARGKGKHAPSARANQDRWMWPLEGLREALNVRNRIMLASKCQRFVREEAL